MQHGPRSRTLVTPARTALLRAAVVIGGGLGLVALTAAPAAAAPPAATATISAPTTATVGDAVDVDVTIPATSDVYAYQVDLTADADVFAVVDGSVTGPAGGFDSVRRTGDTVTLLHTRLGTSPALSGDLTSSVELTATAPGDVDLTVARVTLVAADGSTTTLTDPASTRISVAAAPTPTPTPSATATTAPTPGPATGPGDAPTSGAGVGGGTGVDADPVGTGSRTPAGGALAFTGADLAPWIATSVALLLGGAALVAARRRARAAAAEDAR